MRIRVRTVAVAVLLVAGLAGCGGSAATGGEGAVASSPAAAVPPGAASTGPGPAASGPTSGAARGRELVAELEGQLKSPKADQCLTQGGRECAVWLGAVTKTAVVSVPNEANRFPVAAGRGPRVTELVAEIRAAGDSYARGGCEQQAGFTATGPCERDASAIVVRAGLLVAELKAGGWA